MFYTFFLLSLLFSDLEREFINSFIYIAIFSINATTPIAQQKAGSVSSLIVSAYTPKGSVYEYILNIGFDIHTPSTLAQLSIFRILVVSHHVVYICGGRVK